MRFFVAAIMCMISSVLFAQKNASSACFEFGGPADASLSYDIRFAHKDDGWDGRIGLGGFWIYSDLQKVRGIAAPLEINYFFQYKIFFLESGAGVVYKNTYYHNKTGPVDSSTSFLGPYLDMALRYTSPHSRFIFRAAYAPVLRKTGDIHFAGLSFQSDAPFGVSIGLRLGRQGVLPKDGTCRGHS